MTWRGSLRQYLESFYFIIKIQNIYMSDIYDGLIS